MSNKDIAVKFAKDMINDSTGFVYSDQFFKPFGQDARRAIVRELDQQNILAWWDTKQGAFIFRKDDSRLHLTVEKNQVGGYWLEDTNIMLLPILETV